VTLRHRIYLYLVLLHLALAVVAFPVVRHDRWWLLGVEALLVVSIAIGILLVRAFFTPLQMVRTGAELIREGDFTAHFRETGQPEMDELVRIYNRMIDRLREERLRLEERNLLLDKVLQASPSAMVTLDYEGRVSHLNPSALDLLGRDEEEILGRTLEELGGVAAAVAAVPAGESRILSLPDGRRLRALHGEMYDRGHPRSFHLLDELTREIRSTEKAAYEKLIRMMSHEVANSVGAVGSLLESLQGWRENLPEADREDYGEAIQVARRRLDNLDRFMRDFSRVVRLPAPAFHPTDLGRLVDDAERLLRPEMERRRIRWVRTGPAETPPVQADPGQMEQALVNVLKNAMEAVGEDGEIHARLDGGSDGVELRLRDTGPGLSEEVRERLFTPFFSTKENGLGVGLTLVREILSQHPCTFGLENHPEGGAEFHVRFGAAARRTKG